MGAEDDPGSTFLKNNGIMPSAEGLVAYFKGMKDTPENRKRIAELMRQLGAEEFDVREEAGAEIVKAGLAAAAALRKGIESDDKRLIIKVVNDGTAVKDIMELAMKHQHNIESFEVKKPNLESVFLKLTGKG